MKKLSTEVKFEIAVEIGKLFGIEQELSQEELVNAVNEKIEAFANPTEKAGKWYENTELAYNEDDVVQVNSGWAQGRLVKIVKPSAKKNAFKGYLLDKKTNEPQGTLVTVDEVDIQAYVPTPVEEEQAAV